MVTPQSLEEFYQQRLAYVPLTVNSPLGHFNVFNMEQFSGKYAQPIYYTRKDYFKISLLTGKKKLTYADKVITIDRHALIFSNPLIPYNWELLEEEQSGIFCIFTQSFFYQSGQISQYPIFQPGHIPVFPVNDEQQQRLEGVFLEMLQELNSDYVYREDRLRQLTFELIHQGIKMTPSAIASSVEVNADSRIYNLFTELLERQFPVAPAKSMSLKTPQEFARQLCIHVNHLNRVLRHITNKTTTQLINERIAREAAFMLRYTARPVADIAWELGFEDPSSFSHFFRKHFSASPGAFRKLQIV